jgi:catechol 2,3-dioxygenase-like lactoylglutathione lyase family enzyme
MKIDHVTLAGSDLHRMERAFTDLGLKPEYGGLHSNGITHMGLLGFEDGSYIELISTLQPGQRAPWWGNAIAGNAGPCAWAVLSGNIHSDTARLASAGVPVDGPHAMNRRRPDGRLVEWELTYLGQHEPGATLPFLIQDRSPREWRVQPTPGLREKGLTGLAAVVLAVRSIAAASDLFRRAFGWPAPMTQVDRVFGAALAHFPDTPVILAAPQGTGWLTARLDQFGESPCAFLLKTTNLDEAIATFGLMDETIWFGRRLAWFDPQKVDGARLACTG